jgi:GntR family transcriptional regulator/MocR family aminotransferase
MPRRTAGAFPLLVVLERRAGEPLADQLYDGLRKRILTGRIAAGTRLPSTRVLATELAVSRNTVLTAFERLASEGYVIGRVGAGTRVASTSPDAMTHAGLAGARRTARGARRRPSERGAAIARIRTRTWSDRLGEVRPFRLGVGALSEFPLKIWARLSRRWTQRGASAMDYDEVAGYRPLREAIAAYLRSARGVTCDASQIMIVHGSQQTLDLASRVLLDPGDAVWFEDPGYDGARGAFVAAGARLVPVTLSRRRELLQWASTSGAWVLEDDYDSEFRYGQRPLPAMQGLDADECVIYSGSFSKVLFPGLRLGYVVVPPAVLDAFLRVRFLTDVHPSTITQATLAEFIGEGHFERHVRRMRQLYSERQAVLVESARRHLAGLLTVPSSDGGMHLVGRLPARIADREVSRAARARGIAVTPLSFFSERRPQENGLLLGYAGLTPAQIRTGTQQLASVLESFRRGRTRSEA